MVLKVLGTKGNLKKLALYRTKREATQATRSAFQISDTFAGWLPSPDSALLLPSFSQAGF